MPDPFEARVLQPPIDPIGLKSRDYTRGDILVNRDDIYQRIDKMAFEIAEKYRRQEILLVGVLTGAKKFTECLGDGLSKYGLQVAVDYMKVESGWRNHKHVSDPRIIQNMTQDPSGRIVILTDDVFDTGHTINFARETIINRGANSVETAVLLSKPDEAHEIEYTPEYIGFRMKKDGWAVGFGMDNGVHDGHIEIERDAEFIYIGP